MRSIIAQYKALNKKSQHFICIFIVYLFSQILLLFVSGRWWDDWCSFNISYRGMWQWATEAGRPSIFIFYLIPNLLPQFVYRWITFASYFFISILFYHIEYHIFMKNPQDALLTTLLLIAVPANDARIGMVMFPYSLGVLLFLLGFYTLIRIFEEPKSIIGKRIFSLISFFLSFCLLNANVFLYCLVFLFIMVKSKKILNCIKYWDYFGLPFIFTGLKMLLFPTKGVYENYNKITVEGVKFVLKNFIKIDINTCKEMLFSLTHIMDERPYIKAFVILSVILLMLRLCFKQKSGYTEINTKYELVKMLIGFITFNVAIVSYGIIRMENVIHTEYLSGRDSVLIPFGVTLFFSAVFNITFREFGKKIIMLIIMILSICYFNFHYIDYQTESFWYAGFQENIKNNQYIKDNDAFVVVTPDPNKIGDRIYYVYNGLAEEVFGEETRLFMDGSWLISGYLSGWDHHITEREWYNMKDFSASDNEIDGVIYYSNEISIRETIYLKYLETTNKPKLVEWLTNNSLFELYYPETEEYNQYIGQS